jgi:hypothetical protein
MQGPYPRWRHQSSCYWLQYNAWKQGLKQGNLSFTALVNFIIQKYEVVYGIKLNAPTEFTFRFPLNRKPGSHQGFTRQPWKDAPSQLELQVKGI